MKHRGYSNGHVRSVRPGGQQPPPHQQALAQGLQHHQAGRLGEAEAIYRRVLAADPANAPALHLLGALANQVGQHGAAVELISQAIEIEPAAASYHSNLGVAHQSLGRLPEAVACYQRAIALKPDHVDALNNLGIALQALGRLEEAQAAFERSLKLRPNHAETLANVGALLLVLGRLDEAEVRLRRALKLRPGFPEALTTLGGVLTERGNLDGAVAACQRAVALAPGDPRAHDMLGSVLRAGGRGEEAVASYERTLALDPERAGTWLNLAGALQVAGRSADAIAAYRRCLGLDPTCAIAHSGLIFSLDLLPGAADEAREERRRYAERFGQVWRQRPAAFPNDRDPDRPLRVGYVSADFYHHSAATIFMPVLRSHDRSAVRVYCYSGATVADQVNAEARALADVWHDVARLSDDGLEALIRADQIDVLVDLSGHSAGNRLPVFGRKPAPVQVTAWGYATGTGLDAIDAFLADPVVVPPEEHDRYAERIVDLPAVICFEPPAEVPPLGPPPAAARGAVTFGSFHRLPRLTAEALDAWARIVAAVPDARMVFKSPGVEEPATRERIVAAFARHGVGAERLVLLGKTRWYEHLAAYGEVDIQLDSFPQSGGVTTVEGLLMGVPCVTLLGRGIAERLSGSFLTALGLPDLVARSLDGYVSTAVRLAGDLDRLMRERATLRGRLLASPIGDGRAYTRAVEAAYRELWRAWCAGGS